MSEEMKVERQMAHNQLDQLLAEAPGSSDTVHYYKDNLGEWRWKRVAANGKIVGASSEGYQRLRVARSNFRRVIEWLPSDTESEIIEIDGEEA